MWHACQVSVCEQHLDRGRSASYIKGCIAVIGLPHWDAAGAEPGGGQLRRQNPGVVSSPPQCGLPAAEPWCSPHTSSPSPP